MSVLCYCEDIPLPTSDEKKAAENLFTKIPDQHHAVHARLGDCIATRDFSQVFEAYAVNSSRVLSEGDKFTVRFSLMGDRETTGYFTGEEGILHMVSTNNLKGYLSFRQRTEPKTDFGAFNFDSIPTENLTLPTTPLVETFGSMALAQVVAQYFKSHETNRISLLRAQTKDNKISAFWAVSPTLLVNSGDVVAVMKQTAGPHMEIKKEFRSLVSKDYNNYTKLTGTIKHIWPAAIHSGTLLAGVIVGDNDKLKGISPSFRNDTLVAFEIPPKLFKRFDTIGCLLNKGISGVFRGKTRRLPFNTTTNVPIYGLSESYNEVSARMAMLEQVKISEKQPKHYQMRRVGKPFFG